jgi:hypothetical protein
MPYTHFRYIAYEVPTASRGPAVRVFSGFPAGQEYQALGRIPVPGGVNFNTDARVRLKRLAGVVDIAANTLRNGTLIDNANTLKIFVVPEFYFRPPRALGAGYEHDTYPMTGMADVIRGLDQMFVHADFTHWLFVCGTVMWNQKLPQPNAPDKTLYWNTALYVRGGPGRGGARIVEKQLASRIDGVPQALAPGRDQYVAVIHQEWRNRKEHVFNVDGIPFGLEICLDHADGDAYRVLKRVVSDWPANERGAQQDVKLHVLTAGGMEIQNPSVAAKVGGYILRNDGLAQDPADVPPYVYSEMRQVQNYTWTDPLLNRPTVLTHFDSTGTATLAPAIPAQATNPLPAGPLTVDVPGAPPAGTNYTFPQRLVYYPIQAVPA